MTKITFRLLFGDFADFYLEDENGFDLIEYGFYEYFKFLLFCIAAFFL